MVTKKFQCETCEGNPEFCDPTAFRAHLQTDHNIDPDHLSGIKELMLHINAGKTHTYSHRVTLDNGVVFIMTTISEKGGR